MTETLPEFTEEQVKDLKEFINKHQVLVDFFGGKKEEEWKKVKEFFKQVVYDQLGPNDDVNKVVYGVKYTLEAIDGSLRMYEDAFNKLNSPYTLEV